MSETMTDLTLESRIDVYQDNYGDWRWVLVEGGEATNRSDGYFDSGDDAVASAYESYHHVPIFVDGASHDLSTLPPPPKIDAMIEAARAGIPAPVQMSPEQQEIAEATRQRLRDMSVQADKDAEALVTAEKALSESPDVGMGLDGGPKEDDAPVRGKAKSRGEADEAAQDPPVDDPIANQVRARKKASPDA